MEGIRLQRFPLRTCRGAWRSVSLKGICSLIRVQNNRSGLSSTRSWQSALLRARVTDRWCLMRRSILILDLLRARPFKAGVGLAAPCGRNGRRGLSCAMVVSEAATTDASQRWKP